MPVGSADVGGGGNPQYCFGLSFFLLSLLVAMATPRLRCDAEVDLLILPTDNILKMLKNIVSGQNQ